MNSPAPVTAASRTRGPVARGASSTPGTWIRERMWLVDLLIAASVFVYNLPLLPAYVQGPVHAAALVAVSVLLCAPYLLRLRFPRGVLAVMLLAAVAQLLLGAPLLAADVMLLFTVYTVATRYTSPTSLPGVVLVVGWLLAATLPHLGEAFIDVGQLGVLVVVTIWVWTWGTLVRIRRQNVAGLRERAAQAERERGANARIAVADERARIARELHDIVAHSLSVVVVMSEGAAAKVETEPQSARSAMLGVRDTGRTALADMRRMLGVLREDEPGAHAPQPGISQLQALVDQSRAAGLPVRLTVVGPPAPLTNSEELTVYRLVQEALTNAGRHAGPDVTDVDVQLTHRRGELEVRITDDGQGTASAPLAEGAGRGLMGMQERVSAHGGTIAFGSRDRGGFHVTAVLPLEGGGP